VSRPDQLLALATASVPRRDEYDHDEKQSPHFGQRRGLPYMFSQGKVEHLIGDGEAELNPVIRIETSSFPPEFFTTNLSRGVSLLSKWLKTLVEAASENSGVGRS
jgi:hypothetical protein